MTDLTVHQHPTAVAMPTEAEAERMWALAKRVASTDMVPRAFKGQPDQVLAAMLAGREIGLAAMESLRSFDVVEGKPSPSATLCHTLAIRAGHDLWVSESTRDSATVTAHHRDWPADRHVTVTFDLTDAEAAGLLRKDNWKKYSRAMLRSRAVTEAVRQVCPEVLVGATYTPEELGAPVDGPHGTPAGRDDADWTSTSDPDLVADQAAAVDDGPEIIDAELVDDDDELPRTAGPGDGVAQATSEETSGLSSDTHPTGEQLQARLARLGEALDATPPGFLAWFDDRLEAWHAYGAADDAKCTHAIRLLDDRVAEWRRTTDEGWES